MNKQAQRRLEDDAFERRMREQDESEPKGFWRLVSGVARVVSDYFKARPRLP